MIQITTNPNKQNRQKLCLCLRCMVERSTCLSRQIYYFLMSMNFFPFNLRFILKSWRKAWFLTQHLLILPLLESPSRTLLISVTCLNRLSGFFYRFILLKAASSNYSVNF